jgi:hypothetical protein
MTRVKSEEIIATIEAIPELPGDRLITYARLWQLEIWFRQLVYVELRAKYADDWNKHIEGGIGHARENDKQLHYMPTPEETDLSFGSFSVLIKTISKEWPLFASYLPPQRIWDGKIEEVTQIRNRIAHFRKGHVDDHQRVIQLLRDLDSGFFRFCTSLNQSLYPLSIDTSDPVIQASAQLNPYVKRGPGRNHLSDRLEIKLEIVPRPWSPVPNDFNEVIGYPGYFYDLNIHSYAGRVFHYENLLRDTKYVHDHVVYIVLESDSDNLRIVLPSLLGKEKLIEIIDIFIQASANELWPDRTDHSLSKEAIEAETDQVQKLVDKWPEYVIGPRNPIAFLTTDMPCTIFDA